MSHAYIYDHVRTPRGKGKKDGGLHRSPPVGLLRTLLKALARRNELDTAPGRRRGARLRHAAWRAGRRHRAHGGPRRGWARVSPGVHATASAPRAWRPEHRRRKVMPRRKTWSWAAASRA